MRVPAGAPADPEQTGDDADTAGEADGLPCVRVGGMPSRSAITAVASASVSVKKRGIRSRRPYSLL